MAKRRPSEVKKGAPEWQCTFGDLMNLLLCFFVMLFAMSTMDAAKFEAIAASFNQSFSILSGGASAIGDGMLISNGVSQLNELDEYINSTGKLSQGEDDSQKTMEYEAMAEQIEAEQLAASESLAERVEEALKESEMDEEVDIDFNSQFVQLTLRGALLFDSSKAVIREDAKPVLNQVGLILQRYAGSTIEIEGHTDNVPMNNGVYSSNEELSCARALSVFDYFMDHTTLNPAEVKYSGRGEYTPIADNSTPEGRARNRRVEIRIWNDLSSYQ